MSPRQLAALTARFERREQREDLLAGIMAAASANFGFYAPQGNWLQPWDFVRTLKPPEQPGLTEDQIAANINAALLPFAVTVSPAE